MGQQARISSSMRSLAFVFFAAPALTLFLVSCDHNQPLEPRGATDLTLATAGSGPQMPAPTGTTAVSSSEQIEITWQDMSSNETGFEVHRSRAADGVFTLLATTKADVVAYRDAGVEPGAAQYCYRIRAVRSLKATKSVYSTFSNTGCATPVLAAPSNTSAVAASATQIDLSWQDNSSYETKFEVYRSTPFAGSFRLLATLDPQITRYSDLGLEPGTQYCYKLLAARVSVENTTSSAFSNITCATTPQIPPTAAPSGAVATPSSSSSVTISWIDNSSNEDLFRIDRSTDGGLVWSLWGTAYANTTGADRLPAVAEQQVCYRVVAVNTAGEAPSNAACTTPPAGPTNLVVTAVDPNTMALTWSDNSAVEDGYQVRMFQTNCIGPACDAFDPWCENYGICEQTVLIAALPANSTAYTGPNPTYLGHAYNVLFVVAMKDGGNSDASDPRVPLYLLE